MKKFLLIVMVFTSIHSDSQITYVDAFDNVIAPSLTETKSFNIDINSDGQQDLSIVLKKITTGETLGCAGAAGPDWYITYFESKLNAFGMNKLNALSLTNSIGIDCTGDTLNLSDSWNDVSRVYRGFPTKSVLCEDIGIGKNKQGFRLIKTNPENGAVGFIYGYLDYTLTINGEIILHGWYYQNSFNVPIIADTKLDYPYDEDCIFRDTITVIDTNFIDVPRYVSVTDTLIINLNVPNGSNELINNEILIYPNPTNSHIYVDMGNYTLLKNYEIQILNSIGQPVYYSPIEQQQYYIDLNQWGGKGIYYLRIKNNSGGTLETKKIILK